MMIRLTSHRFAIFHKKFGRLPEPIRASQDEVRNQIFAAAEAQGLNFFILLSYLGMSSTTAHDDRPF